VFGAKCKLGKKFLPISLLTRRLGMTDKLVTALISIGTLLGCWVALGQHPEIVLQSEAATGDGGVRQRGNASGNLTVWMHELEERTFEFSTDESSMLQVVISYSNDGNTDRIGLALNGQSLGSVLTTSTRNPGSLPGTGWNQFQNTAAVSTETAVPAGNHTLTVVVESADEFGVEIDKISISEIASETATQKTLRFENFELEGSKFRAELHGPDGPYLIERASNGLQNWEKLEEGSIINGAATVALETEVNREISVFRARRIARIDPIQLEVELGVGEGIRMPRGRASNLRSVLLFEGQSIAQSFEMPVDGLYDIVLRFANDGGADEVRILIDDIIVGEVGTINTRNGVPGSGWNSFAEASITSVAIAAGARTLKLVVASADRFGIEADVVDIIPVNNF
jgi:hypothetical protein